MRDRKKISTTIDAGTYAYLQQLIASGRARNLAEALDISMAGLRKQEMRARLERDTAAYFERLSPDAATEEAILEASADLGADEIDFDSH